MIRGAIFDVDGTLLDSMSIWDTLGETYLRSLGYEPRENLNETFKNMSLYQAACYYREEYGVHLSVHTIMEEVNAMVTDFYRHKAQPKAHIGNFLKKLRQRNVKMCIATATDQPLVEAALSRCGILEYFSGIFTCTAVGRGKDEPLIFRKALESLGTDKARTVVFEDAWHAAWTAKKDGFPVAVIYDQYERRQTKLQSLADYYLTDYADFEGFWKFSSAL